MNLNGHNILLTGASRGLGRAYARYLCQFGAHVVLVSRPSSEQALNALRDELVRAGGTATALCGDARHGDELVARALESVGHIDALVHNAGSVADGSFAKLDDSAWHEVLENNLMSAVRLSRALWPHFKGRGGGRIVYATSSSGLYGNFGQANYAAAKMALVGLCKSLAIEGQRGGIRVNCIAPVGRSDMNADVLPADLATLLDPELISPLVGFLCHPQCRESGSVFEVAAGWAGKVHVVQGEGAPLLTENAMPRLVDIADLWPSIVAAPEGDCPSDALASLQALTHKLKR